MPHHAGIFGFSISNQLWPLDHSKGVSKRKLWGPFGRHISITRSPILTLDSSLERGYLPHHAGIFGFLIFNQLWPLEKVLAAYLRQISLFHVFYGLTIFITRHPILTSNSALERRLQCQHAGIFGILILVQLWLLEGVRKLS